MLSYLSNTSLQLSCNPTPRFHAPLSPPSASYSKYPCASMVKTPEVKLLLISRTMRQCLTLALVLVFLQQFSGQGAILYYSGEIFGTICPDYASDCVIGFGTYP